MVLKKRQEYGFLGYQIPVIPRAPRSQRARSSKKKSVDDSQLCAFELLAAVAGKLLQESESSASSNATEGKLQLGIDKDDTTKEQVEKKAARLECLDQESCIESIILPEAATPECNMKSNLKELPHVEIDSISGHISDITDSGFLNKVRSDVKHTRNSATGSPASKSEERFHADEQLCDLNLGDEVHRNSELLGKQTGHLNVANSSSSKDSMDYHVSNSNKHSEGSVKFPLYRDHVPGASFPRHRNDVKIVNRDDADDDDENYIRSNQLNTKTKASRPQSSTGYRRMKKFMTSRYWRTAPKLKDCEFINPGPGRGGRPIYHKRKTIYAREGYQREVNSKRRRLYDHRQLYHYRSAVAYCHQASSGSISNSSEKAVKGDKSGTHVLHRATGVSSSEIGHKASFQAMDPRGVKFSIKSFKVPELYIEVPETATVGSLKRTVMEAVNAILEGGLRVGVVLQGKNVGDDTRTLQQIGISQNEVLDSLGFTLEPNFVQATSPLSQKDPALLLPCDKHHGLPRSRVPILDSGFSNSSFDQVPVTNLESLVESNQDMVPYLADLSTEVPVPDSKALVAITPITPLKENTLAIVPVNQKVKRSDLSQRRTRRPFSVSEVEALVEAVEKLGTGRWRDVKMRAFNDVNHRTYVDLKDKWKTLVHTASIAPQQRRGEPVPQELLDRVLAAHAYWSQHQSKQHGKHQIESPLKLAGEVVV